LKFSRKETNIEELNDEKTFYEKKLKAMNYEDKPCQKALIDELINKVYLYDSVRQYALNQGISLSRRTLYIDDGFIVLNHNLEF